jgi:mannose-1-phosphate guanylyltransferase/mannose-6-phosphate isomerase
MYEMIAVIIAGGSGTRLWPLSTPEYPKHLLCIGNEQKSLLQKTYERVHNVADHVYVITEKSHAHHVREQLPEVDESHCVVEPGRRGTANCTLLALAHIAGKHDSSEPIVILWADHYIRDIDGFAHSMKLAANISKRENKIVLVGVEPSYPATGFGYIQKDSLVNDEDFVFYVDAFKEKPDFATAETYVKSGKYLWNSGYFIASIDTFLHAMAAYSPEMLEHFKVLAEADNLDDEADYYLKLESSNIDNALIEKVPELLVVPATFDWMDLGSYGDLHGATGSDEQGNHVVHGGGVELMNVENSFIQNHEEKPVAVIGLDNIVVINTKDGILVARKDMSQAVGEISKKLSQPKAE